MRCEAGGARDGANQCRPFHGRFCDLSLICGALPLLAEFTAEFGMDPATSSLALSLTTGCLAVSILCVGALSETWGRRGLMFASICGAALLNLDSSVAPTWQVLLVVRSLEGLVLGGVPAVAMAYLSEEIPPDRLGRAMRLYVGGTALGGMIGRVAKVRRSVITMMDLRSCRAGGEAARRLRATSVRSRRRPHRKPGHRMPSG
jgi:MFS family permease